MGVPALFRWLSKKYPKIVEPVLEEQQGVLPLDFSEPNPNGFEIDNLFLDMNGIIHPCCHPQDKPAPKSEEEMMRAIFKYLDRIMAMVRPRRLVYLAIDGVAPRAKMNQQRSRRFRAAKEALEKKKETEDESVFDVNVITPGTSFMQRVSDALKYYIYNRMNKQKGWSSVKAIFSDWTVPGEGEHKIVDFIRRQRLDPEYDANQESVIYGLDADLIMLTMATHEARFRVLREDVFWEEEQMRGQCRNCLQPGHQASECPNPAAVVQTADPHMTKPYIFLNIAVLREYLEVEMRPSSKDFSFDHERAIDDWVFLCFFVGNDFLPHLPSLELREGAIDTLIDIYRRHADVFAGPLTKDGRINFERVQVVLKRLADQEEDILRRRKEREDRREENAKRRRVIAEDQETPVMVAQAAELYSSNAEIRPVDQGPADSHAAIELKRSLNQVFAKRRAEPLTPSTPDSASSSAGSIIDEVRLHEPGARTRYYIAKFGKDPKDHPELVRSVCLSYLQGLAWVLGYYYQGCPSWKWFFPYHYAPFAADFIQFLKDADWRMDCKFDLGKPFRPFDQLMSIFPAASASHLPEPFRRLMRDADSELLDFYPGEFSIDLNGKKHAWQGVALLPFIDEDRLLLALEKVYPELSPDHLKLNMRGHDLLFVGERSTAFGFLSSLVDEPDGIWPLDVLLTKGVAGSVRYWSEAYAIGDDIDGILDSEPAVSDNQVMAAFYYPLGVSGQESTLRMHFPARMLPRAQLPKPVLNEDERAAIRAGYYGQRTPNQFHHSMNRDWMQRQEQQSYFRQPNPEYKSRSYY